MMTNEYKSFCYPCLKDVSYTTLEENDSGIIKGRSYSYMRKVARCIHCNEELDVYNDENIKRLYDTYRTAHGITSLEKTREIPAMYGIGKRMLSIMLGWGEQTFSRYYDGYLPTKPYSDILEKLHSDPMYYKSILETHREALGSFTYNKSKRALDEVINSGFSGLSCINRVVAYLLRKKSEITNLSLQKLLYYTQSMSAVFLPEPLFMNQSEAWVHGPVYREIYDLYNESADYIKQYSNGEPLTEAETALVDSVVACFGCYDGDILRAFTHLEDPWLEARGGLPADARSNRKISVESLVKYFSGVRDEYRMVDYRDMRNYARDMFNRVCV